MTRAGIVGAGITKFGTHADVTFTELFAEAALPAFDDAGFGPGEVDTLYFRNTSAAISENDTHLGPKAASQILLAGVPTQRFGDAVAAVVDDIAGGPPAGLRAAKRISIAAPTGASPRACCWEPGVRPAAHD
jgi:acetyl-CoA acetyltransferase